MARDVPPDEIDCICADCGLRHDRRSRLRRLARLLPIEARFVYELYPCTYGQDGYNSPGAKRLYRDLNDLQAQPFRGLWLPSDSVLTSRL